MAATKKLAIKTDVGTFTRRTAANYQFVVVVMGERHELLEARRLRDLASYREQFTHYSDPVKYRETFIRRNTYAVATAHDEKCYAEWLADGSFVQWAKDMAENIATLEALGPITADKGDTFGVLGWCSRLDLAQKLVATKQCDFFRHVRIYALDGSRVR